MAHWKQTRWDVYTLIAPGHHKQFRDYDALFRYYRKFGIDATQA